MITLNRKGQINTHQKDAGLIKPGIKLSIFPLQGVFFMSLYGDWR